MPQDKIDLLYKDLQGEYELGSIDNFKKYLSDDKKRESFFNEIVKPRYDVTDIGTFENLYGLKKKEPATTSFVQGVSKELGLKPSTPFVQSTGQGLPSKTAETTTQLDFTRPQPRISAEEQQAQGMVTKQVKAEKALEFKEGVKQKLYDNNRYWLLQNKKEAQENGMTLKELQASRRKELANNYLDDSEQREANSILDHLDAKKSGDEKRAGEALKQYYAAKNEQRAKFQSDMQNLQAEYDNIASRIEGGELDANLGLQTLSAIEKRQKNLEIGQKAFLKPKEALKSFVQENATEIASVAKPTQTPYEQLEEYTNNLYAKVRQLKADLGYQDMGKGATLGGYAQDYAIRAEQDGGELLDELYAEELKLKTATKLLLLNRTPIQADETALGVLGKSFGNSLAPNLQKEQGTALTIANNVKEIVEDAKIGEKVYEEQKKFAEESAKPYETYSAKWFAEPVGASLAIVPEFVIGSLVSEGVLGVTKLGKLLTIAEKYGKIKGLNTTAKYVNAINKSAAGKVADTIGKTFIKTQANGLKFGLTSEVVAKLFPSQEDELNFTTGYFGGIIGKGAESALSGAVKNMFKVFGNKGADAIKRINEFGGTLKLLKDAPKTVLGEIGEEFGESLGQIYKESDSWKQVGEKIKEQYGTLDKATEFVVLTGIMALGMGSGSSIGSNLFTASKEAYNGLPREQRAIVDAILDDVKKEDNKVQDDVANEVKADLEKTNDSEIKKEIETTTDGEGTIKGAVSAGTDVAEERLGVATEPSGEGITGEGVQTETVNVEISKEQQELLDAVNTMDDNEIRIFKFNNLEDIPESLRDNAQESTSGKSETIFYGKGIKGLLNTILNRGEKTISPGKKFYTVPISGKELRLIAQNQTETVPQAPVTVEEVNSKISVGGLKGGFTVSQKTQDKSNKESVQYKESFDPRSADSSNAEKAFAKNIDRKGKSYRVVGVKINRPNEEIGNDESGRQGMAYAMIQDDGNLPNNIDELLTKKAIEEGKNLYPNLNLKDSDFILPITPTAEKAVSEKVTEVAAPAIEVTPTAPTEKAPAVEDVYENEQKRIISLGKKLIDAVFKNDTRLRKDGKGSKEVGLILRETLTLKEENELYKSNDEYRKLFDKSEDGTITENEQERLSEIYVSEKTKKQVALLGKLYQKSKKEGINQPFVKAVDELLAQPTAEPTKLPAKVEPVKEVPKQEIKGGVTELFNAIPELSNIGSTQQYSDYLDTVFPDSQVNNIAYHGSNYKFDNFKKAVNPKNVYKGGAYKAGFFFSKDKETAKSYIDNKIIAKISNALNLSAPKNPTVYPVVLDIKNPVTEDRNGERGIGFDEVNKSYDNKNDAYIAENVKDPNILTDVYVVFKPEQIHILGSKKDIEDFKKFVNEKPAKAAAKPEVEGKKGFEDLAKKNKLNFRTAQNIINKYVRPFTEADYASATQEDIDLATANRDAGKEREGYKEEKAKKATKTETKKTKPEEIGEGLLDILGIAPVEPTAPAKKSGKTKPVNVSNKSELAELEDQAEGDKKTIIEAAKKGIATLRSIFPDMEIYIHEDTESYNETMSEVGGVANSRGNFAFERDANDNPTGKGRIDINLSNAKDTTVAHELVHAVLLKEFGDNPAVFKAFRDRMSKILRADLNEQVTAFEKLYSGQDVAPEEYLTELAALLSQGGETVEYKPSTLRRVAALINEFVSRITKGKFQPFRSEVDFINFVGFLNQISGAISEGGEIDGITEKINTSAEPTGVKVDTSSLKSKASLIQDLGLQRFKDMGKRITEGVTIKDLGDVESHLTFSDRLVTGKVGNKKTGYKDYLGGILFAAATNRVWASFTKTRVSQIISGMPKNKDGYRYLMPALLTEAAHMSNKDMSNTSIRLVEEAISKGEISPIEADTRIRKALSRKGLEKFLELYSNTIGKNNITPEILISAIDNALVKSTTTFEDRNTFLETLLGKADIDLKKRFGTLPSYSVLANGLAEPITNGHDFGDILLVIRTKGDLIAVQPKEGDADYHPSYPWVIRSVNADGSIAEVETLIFKESYNAVDVFPEVTNKQGQKFTYQQYVDKYGSGAKARYLGYMGARSAMSTSVTEKIVSEAQPKSSIKSKAQVDVYHGSPYDFDKFTTDKIGTGEGAQAFGWGLYFTDLESIARNYAETLGGRSNIYTSLRNAIMNDDSITFYAEDGSKLKVYKDSDGDYTIYEQTGSKETDVNTSISEDSIVDEFLNQVDNYYSSKGEFYVNNKNVTPTKKVYKVSLHEGKSPSEYTFLNFDKPVSKDLKEKIINKIETENSKPETTPFTSSTSFLVEKINSAKTGGELYSILSGLIYGDKNASLFLLSAGIDGIKYPAESISKGATSDTARGFNYVVFDENAVTIKSKSQKAQTDKIKEFIEGQRKAGQSDKDIKAGLELVADKIGLTKEDINDLMSKEVEPAKVTEPKKKLRRMAERIMFQGKEVPDSIAYYTPTTIEAADAKAKELLDELGIDDLVKLISENPEWISIEFFPRVARAAILEINKEQDDIQSKLKKADDKNLSKRLETLSDMKMMVYGKALPISSRAGLSLSMWKDFSEGIPFDHVREVQRIFELSNEKTKNTFIDVLNKLNLINDNVIEQVAAKVANTVGKSKVEKAKANYESSKRSLKDIWNRSRNVGVAETPWERARKNLQFDKALAKAAKDFIIYKSVQFSQFIKEVSDMLGIAESDIDKDHLKGIFDKVKETQIQKGIKGALSDMDMSLKDLIVDHYTELQETEKSLVDKLKESFGLEEADAQEVANEVSKEIRKLSIKEKVKAIKASGLSQGKWVDELLTLSDSGSLEFKDIRDEFAKKIGLRELTDEQMKKLEGLATEMRDQKDPRKKASLAQDLEDYKQVLKTTYGLEDFLVADYLSNLFASVGSNLVNFLGNFQESLGLLNELFFTSIAKGNFKDLSKSFNQFASGTSRGAGFAKQVIMEGKTTYKPIGELKPRQVFEIIMSKPAEDLGVFEKFVQSAMRKKILGKVISFNYKFWNRLLLSMDALSGVTNTELGALEKAVKAANKLGLKGQERSDFLNRELGLTIGVIKNALKTAKELGYEKGSKEYNRLVKDLIIEGRSEETKEYSKKYSMRATLTQEPPSSTLVGAVASGINSIAKKYKATKFIFPVVNTFANLIIKSIERSPFEFISLGADAMRVKTGNLSKEALSDDEIKRRLKAATIFTMAGVALFLMAGGADDEERDFDIFGSGTGDKDLNALLKTKGWKPYSIKFSKNSGYWSFEYTPIGFLLGFVGDLRDLARYKSEEHARLKQMISKKMYKKNYDELDENEKLEVFNEAMSGEYKLDDNYLTMILKLALTPVKLTGELIKSVGAITKIMSGDAEEGIKYLASTGRGVLSPRYGGEIKDIFDNKLYDTKIAWTVLTSNIPFVEVGDVKVDGFGRDITKYDREEGAAGLLQGLKYMVTRRIYNPSRGNEIDFFLAKNMIKILPPTNDLFYTDEKYKEYMALRGIIALEKIKDEMDKGTFDELSPMSIRNEINEILGKANKKAKKEINKTVFRNIK